MLLLMQLLPAEHGIGVTTSIFHVLLVLSFKNLIYTEMMQKRRGTEYLIKSFQVGCWGKLQNPEKSKEVKTAQSILHVAAFKEFLQSFVTEILYCSR